MLTRGMWFQHQVGINFINLEALPLMEKYSVKQLTKQQRMEWCFPEQGGGKRDAG